LRIQLRTNLREQDTELLEFQCLMCTFNLVDSSLALFEQFLGHNLQLLQWALVVSEGFTKVIFKFFLLILGCFERALQVHKCTCACHSAHFMALPRSSDKPCPMQKKDISSQHFLRREGHFV